MDIMTTEQGKEYDSIVQAYMNVLRGTTQLNKVSAVYTLMDNYCEKYNKSYIDVSRDVHLAAITTIAVINKK